MVVLYSKCRESRIYPHDIDKEIQKAFDIANEANLGEEELELQHKKKDWIYIQKSSIELAAKQGLKQGVQQGFRARFRTRKN